MIPSSAAPEIGCQIFKSNFLKIVFDLVNYKISIMIICIFVAARGISIGKFTYIVPYLRALNVGHLQFIRQGTLYHIFFQKEPFYSLQKALFCSFW